jgi:hypothetical protein
MDCATMIVNALKENTEVSIPMIIDASPSMVIMYLAALKSAGAENKDGQPLVSSIKQVGMGSTDKPDLHLYRNLFINSIEGKLQWMFLPFHAPQRAYLHARYGQANFQYWNPEVRAVIESWQQSVEEELAQDISGDQLERFREEARTLAAMKSSGRDSEWQQRLQVFEQVVKFYFDQEQASAYSISQSPDSDFQDTIRAAYRHDLLEVIRVNLLTEARVQTGTAKPSPAGVIIDALKSARRPAPHPSP